MDSVSQRGGEPPPLHPAPQVADMSDVLVVLPERVSVEYASHIPYGPVAAERHREYLFTGLASLCPCRLHFFRFFKTQLDI